MDSLNQLAKQYAEGTLEYSEYKRKRTVLLKNIECGKRKLKNHQASATKKNN